MIIFACVPLLCVVCGCSPVPPKGFTESSSASPLEAKLAECALCHSTKEAQRGPILHGMDEWYLLSQIQKFHAGVRGRNPDNRSEHLMGVAVRKVPGKQEKATLARWFADQEPMPAIRTVQGDLAAGAILYAARCASCHGERAEGRRDALSPSLAELEGWYFIDQMRKFRNGMRGKHPSDTGGQAMAAAMADFSPRQIKDVVAYVVDAFGPPEAPSLRKNQARRPADRNASD